MSFRVRHCAECPECSTRYLIGFSPYGNGSYLVPVTRGSWEEWTLHCACCSPYRTSRWSGGELTAYEVSPEAHVRGYGSPGEIVALRKPEEMPLLTRGIAARTPGIGKLHNIP